MKNNCRGISILFVFMASITALNASSSSYYNQGKDMGYRTFQAARKNPRAAAVTGAKVAAVGVLAWAAYKARGRMTQWVKDRYNYGFGRFATKKQKEAKEKAETLAREKAEARAAAKENKRLNLRSELEAKEIAEQTKDTNNKKIQSVMKKVLLGKTSNLTWHRASKSVYATFYYPPAHQNPAITA